MSLAEHLEKLIAFNAVVKSGSIRKASMILNVTQPALSRSIATLEGALEQRLFTRETAGVTLTDKGAELFSFSEQLLKDVKTVEQKIIYGDQDLESSITIGTYDSIAIYFFPDFLSHIEMTQKGLEINLKTAPSANLMKDLREGRVDLIVSVNPETNRSVISHELYRDSYGFYVSPRSTKLDTMIIYGSASDIKGKQISEYTKSFGLNKKKTLHCQNFETVRALAEGHLGVAILPTRVGQKAVAKNELIRTSVGSQIPYEFGEHAIGLSYLKNRQADSSITWLTRELSRFLKLPF